MAWFKSSTWGRQALSRPERAKGTEVEDLGKQLHKLCGAIKPDHMTCGYMIHLVSHWLIRS